MTDLAPSLLPSIGGISQFLVLGDWGGGVVPRQNISSCIDHRKWKTGNAFEMAKIFHQNVADPIAEKFFVVTTGDNFYSKGVKSVDDPIWDWSFKDAFPDLHAQWLPVLGNHDWMGNVSAQLNYNGDWRWNMQGYLYYTLSVGNVDFFMIDTSTLCPEYSNSHSTKKIFTDYHVHVQLAWLEEVLSASTADFRIVVGHYPVYTAGAYKNENNWEMKRVEDLLKKHRVDAYFCGHDHNLQHLYNSELTQFHHFLSGSGAVVHPPFYGLKPFPTHLVWGIDTQPGFMNCIVNQTALTVKVVNYLGTELYSAVVPKQDRSLKNSQEVKVLSSYH